MLTLIIPTFNRSLYLARLLSYYRERNFPYTIVVADSSDPLYLEQNEALVDSVRPDLRIEHKTYDTDIGIATKLARSAEEVGSAYSVVCADDDFLVPNSLRRAAEFLEAHPDYSIVHGFALKFGLEPGSSVYGPMVRTSRYTQRTVDHPTGAERLTDHLMNYTTTWYSVHRSSQLRFNMRMAIESESGAYFIELLPSALSLIQGKAQAMDALLMVRQSHSSKNYVVPSASAWVASPNWTREYERFCDCLAEELAGQDGISVESAREIVERAFRPYLEAFLGQATTKRNERSCLKALFGAIPGARVAWRRLYRMKHRDQGDMSLSWLLNGSSPYSDDFLPIYRATLPPSESARSEAALSPPAASR